MIEQPNKNVPLKDITIPVVLLEEELTFLESKNTELQQEKLRTKLATREFQIAIEQAKIQGQIELVKEILKRQRWQKK